MHKCDPSTAAVRNGGVGFSVVPTRYEYAGGFNAINSGLTKGRFPPQFTNFFRVDPNFLQGIMIGFLRNGRRVVVVDVQGDFKGTAADKSGYDVTCALAIWARALVAYSTSSVVIKGPVLKRTEPPASKVPRIL